MSKSANWWARKFHRVAAVVLAIPLLIVIASGLLLQVKKQVPWVQPPTAKGSTQSLSMPWDDILAVAESVPEAKVENWNDIDRLDVRPGKGVIKVRCKSGWELQLDSASGEMLSTAYRRSDLIESIHDGSFFSETAKLWLFLPNGVGLLLLWATGIYLWYLPWKVKTAKRRKTRQAKSV